LSISPGIEEVKIYALESAIFEIEFFIGSHDNPIDEAVLRIEDSP